MDTARQPAGSAAGNAKGDTTGIAEGGPKRRIKGSNKEAAIEPSSEAVREVQRQVPREAVAEDYPAPAHLLNRYGAQHPEPAQDHQDYQQEPPFDEAEGEPDPSRYDDALYGQIGSGVQNYQRGQAYSDDPFGYQDDYEEEEEEQGGRRRGRVEDSCRAARARRLGNGCGARLSRLFRIDP